MGKGCTFLTLWKGRMAGMLWVPVVLPDDVTAASAPRSLVGAEVGGLGLLPARDVGLPGSGPSELTLTWRRLVPKLLTDGLWWRLRLGVGILRPNLASSPVAAGDKDGFVKATVVSGVWEI